MSNVSEIREEVSMARQRLETAELKLKELSNEAEPNYCIGRYNGRQYIKFGEDCKVETLSYGNGFWFSKKFIKNIIIDDDGDFRVRLKGSSIDDEDLDNISKVIYDGE